MSLKMLKNGAQLKRIEVKKESTNKHYSGKFKLLLGPLTRINEIIVIEKNLHGKIIEDFTFRI